MQGRAKCQGNNFIHWDVIIVGLMQKFRKVEKCGCRVCLAIQYANTTSSVYPAGPISDNPSSEEPKCFHYYCMKPFTAHFMNCTYWRVKSIGFYYAACLHFSSNSVMMSEHNCSQSCRFGVLHLWMDVVIYLTAADQLTAAIMAVYDFYHHAFITEAYGGIMSERWSQVKKKTVCLSQSCFLIDYFLWFYWL